MSNSIKYDLEDRTAKFGEAIIGLCRRVEVTIISKPLINQLIKCGTSVGANYCEADDAESSKDFRHKIGICKKEAREAQHFIRMLVMAVPSCKSEAQFLWKEARELNLIFNAIYKKVNIK